ncbi:MAG: hypothetical protein KBT29_04840 [Prevotellaceae bacterium]|nr:hypothetical protein [Candidatus Minthosoma caballi]
MHRFLSSFMFLLFMAFFLQSCDEELFYNSAIEEEYNNSFKNTENVLKLINYKQSNQNTHPKVLYFEEGLFEHKYWMSYTPYPKGKTQFENPCVAYSEDGIHWKNIPNNPLDEPEDKLKKYNSDPHLVYNSTTNLLELWFRYADEVNQTEIIYRMTSNNGVDWSNKEQLLSSNQKNCALYLCPTVMHDGSKYLIWVVNSRKKAIEYYESEKGDDWKLVRDIKLEYNDNGTTYTPWHMDIIHSKGKYRMVMMAKGTSTSTQWPLFYSESIDNTEWTTPKIMLYPRRGCWDENFYRSSIVETDKGYALYYSGKQGDKYYIGVSWALEIGVR